MCYLYIFFISALFKLMKILLIVLVIYNNNVSFLSVCFSGNNHILFYFIASLFESI